MRRKLSHQQKVQNAAQLLLYKRHRQPGLKGWELKKSLGEDYPQIMELLDRHLEKLGLTVRKVLEDGSLVSELTSGETDSARFYIGFRNAPSLKEAKMTGWRIDDLAALAVVLAHILTHEGKAPRGELEELLKEKMAAWKVPLNLERFIRQGYLQQDEKGIVYLDWRTRAEISSKELLDALIQSKGSTVSSEAAVESSVGLEDVAEASVSAGAKSSE
jgi:hypothetical protein